MEYVHLHIRICHEGDGGKEGKEGVMEGERKEGKEEVMEGGREG